MDECPLAAVGSTGHQIMDTMTGAPVVKKKYFSFIQTEENSFFFTQGEV